MKHLLTLAVAAVAAAFLAGPAMAGKEPVHGAMSVEDKAGAFTAAGVKAAEAKFDGVTFKVSTHYTVVTHNHETLPTDVRNDLDKAGGDKDRASAVLLDFARATYKARARSGLLTLVYTHGDRFMVKTVTDRETDKYRSFTDNDCTATSTKIGDSIREGKGKPNAKELHDAGLMKASDFVIDQLKDTTVPEAKKAAEAKKGGGGLSILQWVLIIGGGLLVMWIVIGLICALTGGGGGGGGGYGGGGGGGGGFFSGLMGGMFGAMAGMYLYNSMFGGGMTNASAGDSYGSGGDGGTGDTGAGDVDGGAAGGDGDWGGGGGDAGAGGDWGGDAGGGGDWGGGGGGGDFGGGGDW